MVQAPKGSVQVQGEAKPRTEPEPFHLVVPDYVSKKIVHIFWVRHHKSLALVV